MAVILVGEDGTPIVAASGALGAFTEDYKNQVELNTDARHTHTNKTILDNTTASYTIADKNKVNLINNTPNITKPFNTIPYIDTNGVMEAGKYIDFHNDNTTGNDYSTRLYVNSDTKNAVKLPNTSGTLVLTSDITNENLLLNADFQIHENNRPLEWTVGTRITPTISTEGIQLVSTGVAGFVQFMTVPYSQLAGKNITFSIKLNGTVYAETATIPLDVPTETTGETVYINLNTIGGDYLKLAWDNKNLKFKAYYYIDAAETINITYMKLELGQHHLFQIH